MRRDDLLDAFTCCNLKIICQSVSSQGKPRGRLRCGRRARLEGLKTASREGGEAWKTSKGSGDIAHLTSPFPTRPSCVGDNAS